MKLSLGDSPLYHLLSLRMTALQQSPDTKLVKPHLDVLLREDSWKLLTNLVDVHRIARDEVWARHIVPVLCEWLGYLPLDLELVGQYLAEDPNISLGDILKRLQAQQQNNEAIGALQQGMQPNFNTARRGVKAAFELTWQKLDRTTQRIAEFLSLFAPDVIPWKLVESASLQINWVKADLNRAKKQLYEWQLIQLVEAKNDSYKIHPLIREFLQTKLGASKQAEKLRRAFVQSMVFTAQQLPDSPTPKDIESIEDAIPHLKEVTQTLTTTAKDEELLWLFDRLGTFYKARELYDLAQPWFLKCLFLAKSRFGTDHPDVATSLNNLAGLYYAQGLYSKAEPLYLKALHLRKRLLGNNCLEVATSLNNLAGLYYAQGCYNQAESLYLEALELRKRLQRNHNCDVAATLNNLALLYYTQGRYSEAEPLYLEALELRKRLLGNNHIDVATTLNNLASLYDAQGRYIEAKPLLLQALEISKQVLGSNHANTIIFRKNLESLQAQLESDDSWFHQKLTRKFLTFLQRIKS
ncbi:MAG TPA: tetratricopeptide repeat protein [Coleofasciculaceae cyanobacterium]